MPPISTSLLDTEETTVHPATTSTYGDVLRRSCLPEFLAAEAVYAHLDGETDFGNHASLSGCRDTAWFTRHSESGEVRIASKSCHLRWCPLCADAKRNYISFEVEKWVSTLKHPKFLTLTLKHTSAPLEHQVKFLYKYFRSLRLRKHFKKLVTGGIWFFQIKKSKSDGLWHPHIHCLIGGLYIPHGWLKRAWTQITFGSTVVDIRPIHDPHKACNDAARYAAKPGSLSSLSFPDALELVECMHGKRIVGTWGSAKSVSLRAPRLTDNGTWHSIGSWGYVMASRNSNQNARCIAYAYYNSKPLPYGIDMAGSDPSLHRLHELDWQDYDLDAMYPTVGRPP